jgi:serine/threonine protein kinase
MLEQVSILSQLDHPNIIRIHEYYVEPGQIVMIQNLCEGGELLDHIRLTAYDENDAALIIKTLLGAINYCHEKGIVHRDLTPKNILFEKPLNKKDALDFSSLKIVDFGLSGKYEGSAMPQHKELSLGVDAKGQLWRTFRTGDMSY